MSSSVCYAFRTDPPLAEDAPVKGDATHEPSAATRSPAPPRQAIVEKVHTGPSRPQPITGQPIRTDRLSSHRTALHALVCRSACGDAMAPTNRHF
jgi:hypothetical protein